MPNRYRRTIVLKRGQYISALLVLKADKDGWTTSFGIMRQPPAVSKKLNKDVAEDLFARQLEEKLVENRILISDTEDTY